MTADLRDELIKAAAVADSFATPRTSLLIKVVPSGVRLLATYTSRIGQRFEREFDIRWESIEREGRLEGECRALGTWMASKWRDDKPVDWLGWGGKK